jgi:hypothetical protein
MRIHNDDHFQQSRIVRPDDGLIVIQLFANPGS